MFDLKKYKTDKKNKKQLALKLTHTYLSMVTWQGWLLLVLAEYLLLYELNYLQCDKNNKKTSEQTFWLPYTTSTDKT